MPPTVEDTHSDSHVYSTRLRGRMEKDQEKYEDIFSSVVQRITGDGFQDLTREYISANSVKNCQNVKTIVNTTHTAKRPIVCMFCKSAFIRHMDLHQHLLAKHDKADGTRCQICNNNWKALKNAHICKICCQFTVQMDEHTRSHYYDKRGAGAMLECLRCCRVFVDMALLKEHERRSHGPRINDRPFSCAACGITFSKKYTRDQHFVTHFSSVLNSVWTTVEKLQEKHSDCLLSTQCPLCGYVVCSRKSFRLHVTHKHLMNDVEHFNLLVGEECDPQELKMLRFFLMNGTMSVKMTDNDPNVKKEPLGVQSEHSSGCSSDSGDSVQNREVRVKQEVKEEIKKEIEYL